MARSKGELGARLLLIVGVIVGGCGLVLATVSDAGPVGERRPEEAAPSSGPASAVVLAPRRGGPQEIHIPRLGVRARMVPVQARGDVLLPPPDPAVVGWWVGGARPGAERGAAVVTGHTVSTGGGVFDGLGALRAGDVVTVRTGDGVLRHRVASVTTYSTQALADHADRLFAQDAPGRLVLVTCEDWDGNAYLSNDVVVADPVR